ncbi:MAG TPA: histidinol-phosphate transaminase [Synergistaceae bacterium]|nr:histidinol-phosphate transaminase [Synergistaceae bacterium]HPQ38231.1 histidinol-phosphate transaminase [Synergistaceae bacterium]
MVLKGLRKTIKDVQPYVAGLTTEEVQRRFGLERVLKLGSNENNYAPFPSVLRAMEKELPRVHMYPDLAFKELKESLGALYGLQPEHIALSHGAEGALQTLGKMFLDPGDEVILPRIGYGLYREISRVMGAEIVEVPQEPDFRLPLESLKKALSPKTKLLWLANPNNPTGTLLDPEVLEELFRILPEKALVVLDEAYAEFADPEKLPPTAEYIRKGYPLVGVRTFSKAYGLAGMRLGYLLGDPRVVAAFDMVSEPFNANRVALAGARAVLSEGRSEMEEARQSILRDRRRLEEELDALGCEVFPSQTNFVFCRLPWNGDLFAQHLLRRGVIVRPCGIWGLPEMLRITVGTSEEISLFLKIFRELAEEFSRGNVHTVEEIDVML